ncbi:MAG: VanZ family protein [Phycisphaeraceae bacterium]
MTRANTQHESHNASRGPTAGHPLWARPMLLSCAIAVAVLYGSLIPFDFAWSSAVDRGGGMLGAILDALTSPRWTPPQAGHSSLGVPVAASDLVLNLLLYAPLGVTLRMALRPRTRHAAAQVGGAVLLAFAMSWLVESLQSLMPARVASANDAVANTCGALLAALVAPALWGWYKRAVFWVYCKSSGPIARLRAWRDRPVTAIVLALFNAVVIGGWYALELRRTGVVGDSAGGGLPFQRAFDLPYDLGALVLGRAMLVYAGLGCLLLLLTCTAGRRVALGWVVLAVALIALAAELSRAATHDAMPDVTGPLLALAAAALMSVTVYTFSLAVKRSNRRRKAERFDGPDRRRNPHEYAR